MKGKGHFSRGNALPLCLLGGLSGAAGSSLLCELAEGWLSLECWPLGDVMGLAE